MGKPLTRVRMLPASFCAPLPVLLLLSLGCDDDVVPIAPNTELIDVFEQVSAARVDVLWMVDNSGSMGAEQGKVAGRFGEFFGQLVAAGVDYHVGVVTSDPAEEGVLRAYAGPAVEGCAGCRFLTPAVPCAEPAVDTSDLEGTPGAEAAIEARLLERCPAQLVFRQLVTVGIDGSSFEEGFPQVAKALGADVVDEATGLPAGEPPPENEGFVREDASLYVVFVSDEDEGAGADGTPLRHWERLFEGLKGTGNENKVTLAAITGLPAGDGVELPPAAEICPILATAFDASGANDDARAAALLETLRAGGSCTDVEAEPGDPLAVAASGARYVELACRSGGVVANMCEADYTEALDALGANAAGLKRKFTLTRPLPDLAFGADCVPFTDDDQRLDCDDDGSTGGDLDGPLCVRATDLDAAAPVLVPRGPAGWSFETSTNSVRFDGAFLPQPGTNVEIRAFLRGVRDPACR